VIKKEVIKRWDLPRVGDGCYGIKVLGLPCHLPLATSN